MSNFLSELNNIEIDTTFLDYRPQPKPVFEIESSVLEYQKPLDPVETIKQRTDLNDYQKIDLIDKLLVDEYKILEGDFSYMLAATAVGNKKIIKSLTKASKKQLKKRMKRK